MSLEGRVSKLIDFLKPSEAEKPYASITHPASIFCGYLGGLVTAKLIDSDLAYVALGSIIGAFVPKAIEYCLFRSIEAGVFGKNRSRMMKCWKNPYPD